MLKISRLNLRVDRTDCEQKSPALAVLGRSKLDADLLSVGRIENSLDERIKHSHPRLFQIQ